MGLHLLYERYVAQPGIALHNGAALLVIYLAFIANALDAIAHSTWSNCAAAIAPRYPALMHE